MRAKYNYNSGKRSNNPSFWGFKRIFGEEAQDFFEEVRHKVKAEKVKIVSTLELEDEEFIVTKYSTSDKSSNGSASKDTETRFQITNPEEE